MDEPTTEQLAYFNAPATRAELYQVLAAIQTLAAAQMELGAALLTGETDEAKAALLGIQKPMDELAVLGRELRNAGVDPDWGYRG